MQIFLSNLTLTSIAHAFYLNDKLKFNITTKPGAISLDTTLLSVIIP